jgi:hypothetical protein
MVRLNKHEERQFWGTDVGPKAAGLERLVHPKYLSPILTHKITRYVNLCACNIEEAHSVQERPARTYCYDTPAFGQTQQPLSMSDGTLKGE